VNLTRDHSFSPGSSPPAAQPLESTSLWAVGSVCFAPHFRVATGVRASSCIVHMAFSSCKLRPAYSASQFASTQGRLVIGIDSRRSASSEARGVLFDRPLLIGGRAVGEVGPSLIERRTPHSLASSIEDMGVDHGRRHTLVAGGTRRSTREGRPRAGCEVHTGHQNLREEPARRQRSQGLIGARGHLQGETAHGVEEERSGAGCGRPRASRTVSGACHGSPAAGRRRSSASR